MYTATRQVRSKLVVAQHQIPQHVVDLRESRSAQLKNVDAILTAATSETKTVTDCTKLKILEERDLLK